MMVSNVSFRPDTWRRQHHCFHRVAGTGRGKPCSETLLKDADEYLYEAKHGGRNRVCSGVVELTSDQ